MISAVEDVAPLTALFESAFQHQAPTRENLHTGIPTRETASEFPLLYLLLTSSSFNPAFMSYTHLYFDLFH